MRLILLAALSLAACAHSAPNAAPSADPSRPTPLTLKVAETTDAAEAGLLVRDEQGRVTLTLVQRPCRFEAAEPGAAFDAQSAAACKAQNDATRDARTQRALRVPAGKLTIAVSSEQVPYELGFWLRAASSPDVAVAQGGGVVPGVTKTYEVELAPGAYVYSCPLNPTPDYVLIVE
jgi:hypothetical protein